MLIIGCGPAGLVLAAQMANFPDIRTAVIDRRDGPLEVGQADGVACRTVEMFAAFGLADRLVNEAYWVNEVSFWRPDPDDRSRITRTGRVLDTEEGLSELPHVIVNQARMLAYLLDHMERSASRLRPFYGLQVSDVDISEGSEYPVTVRVERADGIATIRARYVVGCDGARSRTRTAIGRELIGDATNESWGVMDVLAVTDFPDIRLKCAIYAAEGNILIIPREGGHLVRFYIALDEVTDKDMLDSRTVTPEALAHVAAAAHASGAEQVRSGGVGKSDKSQPCSRRDGGRKLRNHRGWCVRTTIREMTMYLRQVAAALAGALVLAGAIATDATAQRRDRDDDRRG